MSQTLCVIPARGGSQRIPRKNVKSFHGKPIIAYSIDTALESKLFDAVIVTTDDQDIARIALARGACVIGRPAELARDAAGTQAVVQHALREFGATTGLNDTACCLYATAPLLTPLDLTIGRSVLDERNAHYAFSVGTDPLRDAGAYYWGYTRNFVEGVPLIGRYTQMIPLPPERVMDINTPADWARAEEMYAALYLKAA